MPLSFAVSRRCRESTNGAIPTRQASRPTTIAKGKPIRPLAPTAPAPDSELSFAPWDDPFALPDWRQARAESPDLFAAIVAILFRHDPIGINFGLNTDEYEPEAGTILPRLRDFQGEAEVCRVVHEEFCRWFGNVGDRAEYAPIAHEIWELQRTTQTSRTSVSLVYETTNRS